MFRWSKINQDHRIIYTELCIVTCKYPSVCNYNVQGSYCLSLKISRKKKISATQLKKFKILSFSFENILINIVFTYSHWSLQTPLYLPHILYTLIHLNRRYTTRLFLFTFSRTWPCSQTHHVLKSNMILYINNLLVISQH